MSRKYKFHNPEGVYLITFAVQYWVDVFTRNLDKDILVDNLNYCRIHKDLERYSWRIMTNHVHLVARAKSELTLPEIRRDYKKFTSKKVINSIKLNE